MQVTAVASDNAVEPPPNVGAQQLGAINCQNGADFRLGQIGAGVARPPKIEVLHVSAVNGAAAARYLMMFDATGDPQAGSSPTAVWPLGSAAGQGVSTPYRYRAQQPAGLLSFWTSSTPNTLTATVDCLISVVAR